MGMSASQARLVQLSARMSDVEYEGQQINQQRLALSNKMSDIYSQLQDMDVPTPPSPYNFYEKNYSAKVNGEEIFVTPKEDGKFSMQVPREDDGLEAKNNPVTADDKTIREANDIPSASGIDQAINNLKNNVGKPEKTDSKYQILDQSKYNTAYSNWDAGGRTGSQPQPGNYTSFDQESYDTDCSAWESDMNKAVTDAKTTYKNKIMNHNPQFYSDANCKNAVSDSCFGADGKLNTQLYTMTPEKINGGVTYSIEDAKKEFGGKNNTNFDKLIKALDNHLRDETGNSDSHYGDWKIVVNGDSFEVYKAVSTTDKEGNKKTAYQEFTPGKETVYISSEVTPTLNVDGSPASVKDPATGKTIYLSEKSSLNNDAYNAATNEYLADKAIYDHEQDRLNAETSKIQSQDKKLELKLKRLDTERNAINTEIDAVKKVIQDATEKGFKTFSG